MIALPAPREFGQTDDMTGQSALPASVAPTFNQHEIRRLRNPDQRSAASEKAAPERRGQIFAVPLYLRA